MTDLHTAYKATIFAVDAPGHRFTIRIGEHHPAVDQLAANMLGVDKTTWCHITAHNPRSEKLSNAENDRRTSALEHDLKELRAIAEALQPRLQTSGPAPQVPHIMAAIMVARDSVGARAACRTVEGVPENVHGRVNKLAQRVRPLLSEQLHQPQ